MRRAISLVVAAMLLALLVPLSAVAANDAHGSGTGNGNKITVCHNIDHHAVTIQISNKAWSAYKHHGDTLGACVPGPVKPQKGMSTVCTFSAPTSAAYTDTTNTSALYATGPIRFSWTVATGVVATTGGYWNELYPPVSGATFVANVTSGSVSPGGAVSLSFVRPSDSTTLSFSGTLAGNVLTGQLSGHYFTATGTTSCTGSGDRDNDQGQGRDND